MFNGTTKTFEMLKRPDTVKAICIKDDKILAITDQQPGRRTKFTLPGGRHDVESETELDCAKREVREETGMTFKTWKLLWAEQFHSKIEQVVYIYLATDIQEIGLPELDGGEQLKIYELSFAEAKNYSETGIEKNWPVEIFAKVNTLQQKPRRVYMIECNFHIKVLFSIGIIGKKPITSPEL